MKNKEQKDFNKMLLDDRDMPVIKTVIDKRTIDIYGGDKMLLAPPRFYDELMKKVPYGKIVTVKMLREYLAKRYNADFTDPMTAGIFVNICAWASSQRNNDCTPYWRTVKSDSELNEKYPNGIQAQREMLEKEGHTIIEKGRTKSRYYVESFEKKLFIL